jgi:hypothetical protein
LSKPRQFYYGKDYLCMVCKLQYTLDEDYISDVDLVYTNGESLEVTLVECPNCKSFSIAEGLNQIAWLMEYK